MYKTIPVLYKQLPLIPLFTSLRPKWALKLFLNTSSPWCALRFIT